MGFVIRVLINAVAVLVVSQIVRGIEVSGFMAAVAAGLVLGVINAFVRPVLILLTLPFTLLTLGFFLFLLNGFCLWLASTLVKGFVVTGFFSAVFGAILISLVSWVLTAFLSDQGKMVVITKRPTNVS